ncbi:MAG: ATP-dependent metallopeptidase FtsH/Yme1/Tma family protein [Gemmatimonadaceae bacterium]
MLHQVSKLLRSRAARWSMGGALVLTVMVGATVRLHQVRATAKPIVAMMRYSDLIVAMRAGQVDSLLVLSESAVRAWLRVPSVPAGARDVRVEYGERQATALVDAATAAKVGVAFAPKPADHSEIANLITTIAIMLGLGALLYVVLARQSGGSAGNVDVTAARGGNGTTFADVAGNSAAIADLREVVEFLREPKRFSGMGATVPRGLLLEGPPGTGKTLMARALAGEAGTNFFATSGPDFSGMFVGVGTMRVKALFRRARKAGGGVIFIDEIDSLGGKRGRQGGHQEDDRTLNQLLVELDGFGPSAGIIVVAATNRAGDLDPALLRKGRFDRSVTVGLPTVDERREILALHAVKRQMPLADDVELTRLARLMSGASGADLEALLNEAAILAVRGASSTVSWLHLEEARDRVLLGRAREGVVVSDVERRLVALHEAGHALAGVVFAPNDPLHKVTIQPRGSAMGVAFFQPDHEMQLHSRQHLEGQIRKGLGGRAAEELIYGAEKITNGASSDLQHTTRVAKQMVYRLGMGRSTGLVVLDPDSGPLSDETQNRMDADVRAILEAGYADVMQVFREQRSSLEALADALLERETLTGAEALVVLRGAGLAVA